MIALFYTLQQYNKWCSLLFCLSSEIFNFQTCIIKILKSDCFFLPFVLQTRVFFSAHAPICKCIRFHNVCLWMWCIYIYSFQFVHPMNKFELLLDEIKVKRCEHFVYLIPSSISLLSLSPLCVCVRWWWWWICFARIYIVMKL